jgi:hypothetical protein
MLGDIVGYCQIKSGAKSGKPETEYDFTKAIFLRVMEFDSEGGVLVINPEATELAMFDVVDVKCSFKCEVYMGCILPPDLDIMQKMLYANKLMGRKGGYNLIIKNMVIMTSLHKGRYSDGFLFQKTESEQC